MAIRYFLFMGRPLNLPRFSQTTNSAQQILNQTTIQNNENNQFECLFNYTGKQGRSIACSTFSVCLYFLKNLNFTFKKTLQIKKKKTSPKLARTKAYIFLFIFLFIVSNISQPWFPLPLLFPTLPNLQSTPPQLPFRKEQASQAYLLIHIS